MMDGTINLAQKVTSASDTYSDSDVFGSTLERLTMVRNFGVNMVDIYVGPTKHRFHVYKDILCSRVPYFEKMFKEGGFIEWTLQAASLPEDGPAAFGLLLQWVYVGRLVPIDISKSTSETGPFIDLMKLYVLAEKICLPDLADYIMTKLISSYLHHNLHPSTFAVKLAYQIAGPSSHLRFYMVNDLHFRYKVLGTDMIILFKAFVGCDDLLSDFIALLETYKALDKNPTSPREDVICKWHYHRNMADDGHCQYKTKDL